MFTISFDKSDPAALYEQLYRAVRDKITQNQLHPGQRLPSKRALAEHLKISRNTVEAAYAQLVAEGYVRAEPRRGYFVETLDWQPHSQPSALSGSSLPATSARPSSLSASSASGSASSFPSPDAKFSPDHTLASHTPILAQHPSVSAQHYRFDLQTSRVDTASFPFATWSRLNREVLAMDSKFLLENSHPQGLPALREEIARYLAEYRGVRAQADQIVIGAGSEYLLMLMTLLLGRDRVYAVENPGYEKIRRILSAQAPVLPLALDHDGLRPDLLRSSGAQILHLTPSHHFPLGMVMPVSRRLELLAWAQEDPVRWIIEDDYDSEFRFTGRPIPAMQGMDSEKVLYFNTFAKSLAPTLRISYMVLPPALAERFREHFSFYACTVPSFEQYTLQKFMAGGHFERHLSRMRKRYRARRDALLDALTQTGLNRIADISGQEAGLHLLVRFHQPVSEQMLVRTAAEQGVGVHGLSSYCAGTYDGPPTILLGYGGLRREELFEAAVRLSRAWLR